MCSSDLDGFPWGVCVGDRCAGQWDGMGADGDVGGAGGGECRADGRGGGRGGARGFLGLAAVGADPGDRRAGRRSGQPAEHHLQSTSGGFPMCCSPAARTVPRRLARAGGRSRAGGTRLPFCTENFLLC